MEKRENILVVLLAIVAMAVIVIQIITNNQEQVGEITKVTNYNDFYTVNSCINRSLSYISESDSENLLLLTSKKYIKSNKITKSNVLDFYEKIEIGSTFSSKDMYYQTVDELEKYYVYGIIKDEGNFDNLLEEVEKTDAYFIIYLDKDNGLFSIEPYDGEIFKEGVENE